MADDQRWVSDANLLKAAGLIIATLIGGYYVNFNNRQAITDTKLDLVAHDVAETSRDVSVLKNDMTHIDAAVVGMDGRLSVVEQGLISTRDKANELERAVDRQQQNLLEKKYQKKAREVDSLIDRNQRNQRHYEKSLDAAKQTIAEKAHTEFVVVPVPAHDTEARILPPHRRDVSPYAGLPSEGAAQVGTGPLVGAPSVPGVGLR